MKKVIRIIKEISKDAADEFRPKKKCSKPQPDCPICLEQVTDKARVKPCGHVFDLDCIVRWVLSERDTVKGCPCCRAETISLRYWEFNTRSGPGYRYRNTTNVAALICVCHSEQQRADELANRNEGIQASSMAESAEGRADERSRSVTEGSTQEHDGEEEGGEDDESVWEQDWESEGRSEAEGSHGDGLQGHGNAG